MSLYDSGKADGFASVVLVCHSLNEYEECDCASRELDEVMGMCFQSHQDHPPSMEAVVDAIQNCRRWMAQGYKVG